MISIFIALLFQLIATVATETPNEVPFLIECHLKVWKHEALCNNTRYGKIDCHEYKLNVFEYESM